MSSIATTLPPNIVVSHQCYFIHFASTYTAFIHQAVDRVVREKRRIYILPLHNL